MEKDYCNYQVGSRYAGSAVFRALVACVVAGALLFGVVARPASAVSAGATVAVAGGSIGTAGLGAGAALGSLALPVLGVVGVALLACGVDVALSNASAEAGMTKTEFIRGKLSDFAEARGQDFNHLVNTLASHMSVMQDGTIVIGSESGEIIQQFGNWLYSDDTVVDPDVISGGDGVTISGYPFAMNDFYFGDSMGRSHIERYSGGDVYACISSDGNASYPFLVLFVAYASNTYVRQKNADGNWIFNPIQLSNSFVNDSGDTVYWATTGRQATLDRLNGNTNLPYNPGLAGSLSSSLSGSLAGGSVDLGDDVFTGKEQNWTDNKDLLIPGSGEATIVTGPDVINPAATAVASGDYTISVPDYLDALARAYNAGADAAIDVALTNTSTGALTDVAITDVAGDTATIARDTATAATDAANPLAASGVAVDGPGAIDAMSVPGLAGVFPFCIPYDVRDMLALLSADPVAPSYHVSWAVPYFDDPIEFDVDLSGWNGVAAVLRTMELLAFTIGLAVNTRQLFLRG